MYSAILRICLNNALKLLHHFVIAPDLNFSSLPLSDTTFKEIRRSKNKRNCRVHTLEVFCLKIVAKSFSRPNYVHKGPQVSHWILVFEA